METMAAAMRALLALSPFLWLVLMSFKTNAEIFRFPPRLRQQSERIDVATAT